MMIRFLRHPATNAVGVGVFSLFYGIIYLAFSDRLRPGDATDLQPFWRVWNDFLNAGGQRYIAVALLALTVAVLILLLTGRKSQDEYQIDILLKCLAIAAVTTLVAIALFFLTVLIDATQIMSKFVLFTSVNWTIVVIADLIYLMLCGRR